MTTFDANTKGIFVNGEWKEAKSGETEVVDNPTTLEKLTEVSNGDFDDATDAIDAAYEAFPEWSKMNPRKRSKILYRAYELMMEDVDRLGEILTLEQGKPLKEAKGEIKSAASFLQWYSEEANRIYGEMIPASREGNRQFVLPQPVGVVGAITPWNFPSSMITRKCGPALAAGCTVVLKPAMETPLSAIEIAKIFEKAGLPKGVFNLVTGKAQEIGEAFLTNNKVRKITFTGSTEVGKYLMRESADQLKKISLELGGHAPILVFEDADLETAANLTLASKFRNAGQTCICANRVYVQESIKEEFSKVLLEKVKQLNVGNGLNDGVDIGPLINENGTEKVQDHLNDATDKGARILCGGTKWDGEYEGHFFEPTLLDNITDDMKVMNEETFGPLLPLQTFKTEEEAIKAANNTKYGLAAYFFTENLDRTFRVSEALEYGMVGVNEVFPSVAEAPFGGIKQSGFGKEGGHHGIDDFVVKKLVTISEKQ
uniref:NAD-dependent succinate-semialdehyde dehydrogenase n=1 Tax=uncultured Allobacillus sp. TaxID=1638025 RepID=UPI00259963A9|nr:NAD-dependent succinate-semialdehyde dehydrogenase [uncultured Allobacillus sp.]